MSSTSKKVKAVFAAKEQRGERLGGKAPYGYTLTDKKLIINPDTAPVVKRIFALCLEGLGPSQIARKLSEDGVLTPGAYDFQTTGKQRSGAYREYPTGWSEQSIAGMLENREYMGHTVIGKKRKPSYKNKKLVAVPPDEQTVFENTHEAIVDAETFALVQKVREHKRRQAKIGDIDPFSGLIYCADCGKVHYNCRAKSLTREQEYFFCGAYRNRKGVCTPHSIRTVVLEKLVLEGIRNVSAYARYHEDAFTAMVSERQQRYDQNELASKRKELDRAEKRMVELDHLFRKIYEDNASARLSDERFDKLAAGYEAEQAALKERIPVLEQALAKQDEQAGNADKFLAQVRKYTDIQELTPTILREFIEKIVVHEKDKPSGKRIQRVEIHYNFVGEVLPMILENAVRMMAMYSKMSRSAAEHSLHGTSAQG